jgi:hypothetical protein
VEQHAGARRRQAEAFRHLAQGRLLVGPEAVVGEGDEAAPAEQRVQFVVVEAHGDAGGESAAIVDGERLTLPQAHFVVLRLLAPLLLHALAIQCTRYRRRRRERDAEADHAHQQRHQAHLVGDAQALHEAEAGGRQQGEAQQEAQDPVACRGAIEHRAWPATVGRGRVRGEDAGVPVRRSPTIRSAFAPGGTRRAAIRSERGTSGDRAGYAPRRPAAARLTTIVAMPAQLHASGKAPNTTAPNSVANATCR